MKKTNLILAVIFICILNIQYTANAQKKDLKKSKNETTENSCGSMYYTCPMHLEVKSDKPGTCLMCGMSLIKHESEKGNSSSNMLMTPTFQQTVDGVKTQIWIMTQEEHKKMMEEMKTKGKTMNDKSMIIGNYHIKVKTTDAKTGKDINASAVELKIVSPSKKSSDVKLVGVMNHFGNGLTLNEKGKYDFTAMIKISKKSQKAMFSYDVK